MWIWTCPKQPGLLHEAHSWTAMNETLTWHENGFSIPGHGDIPPCEEEHEYWDDGEPCSYPKCNKKYIRDDEPIEAEPTGLYGRRLSDVK